MPTAIQKRDLQLWLDWCMLCMPQARLLQQVQASYALLPGQEALLPLPQRLRLDSYGPVQHALLLLLLLLVVLQGCGAPCCERSLSWLPARVEGS